MFDYLKNLTKSDEEKRQEAFSAYLDNRLPQDQRQAFEQRLAADADLRAELELAQLIRQHMSQMPRRAAPRSFTLDAAVYGKPRKEPLVRVYPFLRAATVMTAFFFVLALGLSVFTNQGADSMAPMAQTAMEPAPAQEAPMVDAEIAMEEVVEAPVAAPKAPEEFMVTAEVMEEGDTVEFAPLPTLTASATAVSEMESMEDAAAGAEAAALAAPPAEEAAGAASMQESDVTPLPTATVSALPRPAATETAVARLAEPTDPAADELANAAEMQPLVAEPSPEQTAQPYPVTTWLLFGLGFLLLFLVVLTLLARRRL